MNANTPMKDERRMKIGQILVALAEYYDIELNKVRLRMYVEDLVELSPETLLLASRSYRRDPANTRYPLPAQLLAMGRSGILTGNYSIDVADDAKVAASNIVTAVGRYGYTGGTEAQEWMGSLAWEVVKQQGGWSSVCRGMDPKNKSTQQAQFRDLAASILKRAQRGAHSHSPSLVHRGGEPQLTDKSAENPDAQLKIAKLATGAFQ